MCDIVDLPVSFVTVLCKFERGGHNACVVHQTVQRCFLGHEKIGCSHDSGQGHVIHNQYAEVRVGVD